MPEILLSKIVVKENRQRQEFDPDALQELKNSIEDLGLMHPPVLRPEGDAWVLVAGERRMRAIREIFELGGKFKFAGKFYADGLIPFTDIGELSELEAEEAELDENLKRRDLTWQEHAAAVKRLHELRQRQSMAADAGQSRIDPDPAKAIPLHTVADTAMELHGRSDGSYQDSVRKELIVARHLDNPVIAKAKSADEAFKLLKREEERKKNVELAKTVGATFTASKHRVLNVNCVEWMAKPENQGYFDVILTDPPYGMGAHEFGDGAGRLDGIEHHYDDSYESWVKLMEAWCPLTYEVTKPEAHAYVFCDLDNFHELKRMMVKAGWYVFRTPLINVKQNSGRVPLPDRGPRRQYEIVLYAIKGSKPVTHIYPDVIMTTADENMSHGAQKPVAVYENLLQRSVRPGDRVLDSFGGTGPLIPACHHFKCEATVLEQNPEYYAMSVKRLEEVKRWDEPALF